MRQRLRLTLGTVLVALSFSGCMMVRKPSAEEMRLLDAPPAAVSAKINRFFPRVRAWYDAVETQYAPQGRPLTVAETDMARRLGVARPAELRVVVLENFPMPADAELRAEAEAYGLGSPFEGGRTHGSVILLKPDLAGNSTVLRHEFVHVAQQDRMGRDAFLRRYLVEMEILGYARSPLELEAYARQGETR